MIPLTDQDAPPPAPPRRSVLRAVLRITLVVAAAAAAAAPAALAWCVLPYFAWQFFHYQKQNVGMAALAAASHRVAGLRPAERRVVMLAGATEKRSPLTDRSSADIR